MADAIAPEAESAYSWRFPLRHLPLTARRIALDSLRQPLMSTPLSSPQRPPSFWTRPSTVALLLLLALAGGAYNWWQQSQNAPSRAHLEAADRYVRQGRGADAEREWKAILQRDSNDAGAWELLGDYYLTIGDAKAARVALEQVWKLKPDTPEIHYRLAVALVQVGEMKAAREQAEAELKQHPNHVGALDTMTLALQRDAKDSGAGALTTKDADDLRLKYLQRLTELEPTNELYLSRLADGLIIQRRYAEARPVLDKLVRQNPEFGAARSMHGVAIFYTDPSPHGLQIAAQDLQAAVAQNPNDAVALQFLGKVLLRQKKAKAAIVQLEKAGALLTVSPTYLFDLASAYQMAGEPQKALALRRRYAALEQQTVAIDRFKSQLSNNPQDFEAALGLGLLLLESEKPVGARKYLQVARQLRPQDPRPPQALQRLQNSYETQLRLAERGLQAHDLSAAGHHLSRAMLLLPTDPRTKSLLRRFQAATGSAPTNAAPKPTSSAKP